MNTLYFNLNRRLAKQPWFTAVMQRNEQLLATANKDYCYAGKLIKHRFEKFDLN